MSEPTTAPTSTSAHRLSTLAPPAPEISSTYRSPADPFPSSLAELELVQLHVLHSRVTRQLDRAYRTNPAGSHPVTLDRIQELVAELDTRQDFLAPTDPTSPAKPRVKATRAYRSAATTGWQAADPPPMPATVDRADTAGTEQTALTTPRQAGKRGDGPSRPRRNALSDQTLREAETPIQDLDRLRPGHQIEVWYRGQIQYVGTVEETVPSLGMMWGRETLDGYRRMVHTQDTELRHHLPSAPQ